VTVISPAVNTFFLIVVESEGVVAALPVSGAARRKTRSTIFFIGSCSLSLFLVVYNDD
jgi:hypothetical protein